MAPVNTILGRQLLVQISDNGSPDTFAHDCLINTERGIQFASETNREQIPDCLNPTTPGWSSIDKTGLSATITGAGKVHTTSIATWAAWFNSNDTKPVRVLFNGITLALGGGYWAGNFKLTGWEVAGPETGRATVSVTLESDGDVIWYDALA